MYCITNLIEAFGTRCIGLQTRVSVCRCEGGKVVDPGLLLSLTQLLFVAIPLQSLNMMSSNLGYTSLAAVDRNQWPTFLPVKKLSDVPANAEIMGAADCHFTEQAQQKLLGWGINKESIMSCMMDKERKGKCTNEGIERMVNAKIMHMKGIGHGVIDDYYKYVSTHCLFVK